jgi:hyperosmotically inducible periplasmic protein
MGEVMKFQTLCKIWLPLLLITTLSACTSAEKKSPDVSGSIRSSLDQAGLKDVSVKEERDKGVITLSGKVQTEGEKVHADTIAKSQAGGQVVANQIAVVPPDNEADSKAVNSDVDKGIEKNLDAALIQKNLHDDVKYDVKNAVVTLTGNVNSQSVRQDAEKMASLVPNVKQVVNELQVKDQKATSRN